MPILGEEIHIYPDTLLEGLGMEVGARRWWLIYTKSRQEKALARHLVGGSVPFYLPLVKKTSVQRGRTVSAHHPLFTGYLFLFGSDEERVVGLTSNRISRVLEVSDGRRLYRDLCQIRQLIASDAPLTVEKRLTSGQRVRVRKGSLEGIEGTVLHRRGQCRLLVAVDFMQQGASVEIEDYLLEPV